MSSIDTRYIVELALPLRSHRRQPDARPAPPPPADVGALADELAAAVEGSVRFDAAARGLYAYDASIFRQVPIGVVVPRHDEDVVAALEVCRRHGAPVLPRGCGTSLAGQTVNAAVVFDFSQHLNTLVHLDPHARRARVQPGLVCDQLRDAASKHGLTYGADPATHDHATFGGMIGNNSCGTHSVYAGKTVDNVDELDIVTYDGLRMRVGRTTAEQLELNIHAGGRRGAIYAGLARLRDTYADDIRTGMPDIPRRVSGYNLDQLLPENGFNVAGALVGTEGTCAITLGATVRLVPSPPKRALVVLGYPDIPASGYDVPWLMDFHPIALEFTSRHVLENIRRKGMSFGAGSKLPDGEAWLLVEFGGANQEEADGKAETLFRALERRGGSAPSHRLFDDPADEDAVWEVRRHSGGTSRMPVELGDHGGWPNWEDAAVAPDKLGDYLTDYLALLRRYDYDGVFFGHWGQGCVHCRIDYDLRTANGIKTYRRFMEEATDLVVSYGGSISGEHGDGHGRAELWSKMFSPRLMRAFAEFKGIWDPDNRMNPGKLVDPYPLDAHLREGTSYKPLKLKTAFQFPVDGHDFTTAVGRCFGVGKCRHLDGGVMCPSFMVTREEEHSTRGRARLLQEMAQASGPVKDRWRSEEVKSSLDLCLACKGCKGECPVKVDVATYKAEFLHHYYKGRIRPRQAYALGLIPVWARLASRMPRLANAATHAPVLRRVVKRVGGVAPEREPPRFATTTFREWFDRHQPRHPDGERVLLWPDTFVNYFEPEVGIATVEVLEAAGFRVDLPRDGLCCGRPLYDYGMLTLAKRYLRRILAAMRDDIRAGVPLVGMEPSCLAVFRDELLNLFPDDADAQRLAGQSLVLSEFFAARAPKLDLPQLDRRALVQGHCHQRSVIGFDDEERILRRLGLDLDVPDSGCCGMAGSFGYEAGERYDVSVAAGERVLLPAVRAAGADTIVVADGFSCRSQIASGTGRRALHLAEVIALGYREGRRGPARRPETATEPAEPAGRPPVLRTAFGAAAVVAGFGVAVTGRRRTSR